MLHKLLSHAPLQVQYELVNMLAKS